MTDSFYSFVAIVKFEDIKYIPPLLPSSYRLYVKAKMEEDDPSLRRIAIVNTKRKVTVDYICSLLPMLVNVCGYQFGGREKHILLTKYIRWREWMTVKEYSQLAEHLKKKSKFYSYRTYGY